MFLISLYNVVVRVIIILIEAYLASLAGVQFCDFAKKAELGRFINRRSK